jgi:hypothetical protein
LATGSFFTTGAGAFLNVGSFGFGLGAEKNDESDFASFTDVTIGFGSFFTTAGLDGADGVTAIFFAGGAIFEGCGSLNFRFLLFASTKL